MSSISRSDRKRHEDPQNLPQPSEEADLVIVDTTWGEVQPLQPVPDVATVGELELIALLEEGALLVDSRVPDSRSGVTLPGAVNVPHDEAANRLDEMAGEVVVLFCNGPQCPQTPDALRTLVAAGVDPRRLRYYRGGLHDWLTLGFPTVNV